MDIWFDRQANPIDAATANERLMDRDYSRVGLTRVTSASNPNVSYMVSTVWLATNYNFLGGPPILFETMVFGGGEGQDQSQWRWGTEVQAEAGHAEIVATVAATVDDALVEDLADWPRPVDLVKVERSKQETT